VYAGHFGSAESHYDSMTVTASALALLIASSVEIEKLPDVDRHEYCRWVKGTRPLTITYQRDITVLQAEFSQTTLE